ncbi:hypothetical protein BHE74_00029948 [Ensete ventricosum]|nr:hypothetical protein BHE74_00029948 [Ensete ventricosum]
MLLQLSSSPHNQLFFASQRTNPCRPRPESCGHKRPVLPQPRDRLPTTTTSIATSQSSVVATPSHFSTMVSKSGSLCNDWLINCMCCAQLLAKRLLAALAESLFDALGLPKITMVESTPCCSQPGLEMLMAVAYEEATRHLRVEATPTRRCDDLRARRLLKVVPIKRGDSRIAIGVAPY